MQEAVFDSRLLKDGHLYCPKEFANPEQKVSGWKILLFCKNAQKNKVFPDGTFQMS